MVTVAGLAGLAADTLRGSYVAVLSERDHRRAPGSNYVNVLVSE